VVKAGRDLAEGGHRVIGIDVSPTLLEAAREAHPDGTYLVADAAKLPFPGNSFDLVVAYNFLMDADDLPGCVREASRVLKPGCKLVLSVLHPANTGKIVGEGDDAAFLVDGSYFEGGHNYQEVDRDGVHMVFSGHHHPLGNHTRALEDAGLLIAAVREPIATRVDGSAHKLPWHLWMRTVKPA
jgi:SAM-dependent methyltransferase